MIHNDEPESQTPEDRTASERKERVLHTRVPAVLEQELKRLAQSWRVPVSNLVRAILEDAVVGVDLVGRRAEGQLHRVVDRLSQERERLRNMAGVKESDPSVLEPEEPESPPSPIDGVIGYQPLMLAKPSTCALCRRDLMVGEQVFLGVRDQLGPRVLIGQECLPNSDSTKENTDE